MRSRRPKSPRSSSSSPRWQPDQAASFPARVTEISPVAEFTPKAVETREERVNLVYAAKVDLDRLNHLGPVRTEDEVVVLQIKWLNLVD